MALVELPVTLGIEVSDETEDGEKEAFHIAEEILSGADERLVFAKAYLTRLVVSRD